MKTRKPAPPKDERPLCMGCGKPLKPDYDVVSATTGESVLYRVRGVNERVRVWTGHYQGLRPRKGALPTHCGPTCAAAHAVRLAQLFIDSDNHAVVLTADGVRRATHGRLAHAARDILSTDGDNRG